MQASVWMVLSKWEKKYISFKNLLIIFIFPLSLTTILKWL